MSRQLSRAAAAEAAPHRYRYENPPPDFMNRLPVGTARGVSPLQTGVSAPRAAWGFHQETNAIATSIDEYWKTHGCQRIWSSAKSNPASPREAARNHPGLYPTTIAPRKTSNSDAAIRSTGNGIAGKESLTGHRGNCRDEVHSFQERPIPTIKPAAIVALSCESVRCVSGFFLESRVEFGCCADAFTRFFALLAKLPAA